LDKSGVQQKVLELPPGSTTEISPKIASQKQQDAVPNNPYNFPIQNVVFDWVIHPEPNKKATTKLNLECTVKCVYTIGQSYFQKCTPLVLVHQNIQVYN